MMKTSVRLTIYFLLEGELLDSYLYEKVLVLSEM